MEMTKEIYLETLKSVLGCSNFHYSSLFGNLLTGKGIVRAGSGNKKRKGFVRAGSGHPPYENKKEKGIVRVGTGNKKEWDF